MPSTYLSHHHVIFSSIFAFGQNSADTSLDEGLLLVGTFETDFGPLVVVHMEHNHVLSDHPIFRLPSIDDHASLVSHRTVVFASPDACAFSLNNADEFLFQVELKHLVCALPHLSLCIIHKAPAKDIKLILVKDSAMALPSLDDLLGFELGVGPVHRVGHDARLHDFFNRLISHATDHIQGAIVVSQRCALSWRRRPPFAFRLDANMNSKTLTLLHALDVRLQPAG